MMKNKKQLINNIDKVHTTQLGINRIKNNLNLDDSIDIVEYCKNVINNDDSVITKKRKELLCNL